MDGYANGWKLDPSKSGTLHVTLTWTPQRVVWIAIALSAAAMVLCLALVALPLFRRRMAPLADDATPPRGNSSAASIPASFDFRRALEYRGARPKLGVVIGVTLAAAIGAGLVAGAWTAPIFGIAALVCLRFRRARPVLSLGAPACVVIVAGYYVAFVAFRDTYLRFGWPSWFSRIVPLGWFAVIALVLDLVVDRCWLRRWWPTRDADD